MIFDNYVRALATTSTNQTKSKESTMSLNKHVRTLASASLLALAIASMSTGFVHAAHDTQRACESAGYSWDFSRGKCADKKCLGTDGLLYTNGQRGPDGHSGHNTIMSICDGVTGQWNYYRTADPQGPLAPHTTTTGTNAPPEQAPANPLTPRTTGTYSQP